jgi:hypothetical protein
MVGEQSSMERKLTARVDILYGLLGSPQIIKLAASTRRAAPDRQNDLPSPPPPKFVCAVDKPPSPTGEVRYAINVSSSSPLLFTMLNLVLNLRKYTEKRLRSNGHAKKFLRLNNVRGVGP